MQRTVTIRKVPADSVPYGEDICTHGKRVWAVFEDSKLVCVGATAKAAREAYKRRQPWYGRPPVALPSELDGRRDKPHKLGPNEPVGEGG